MNNFDENGYFSQKKSLFTHVWSKRCYFSRQDMKERVSENPLAYTGNKLHFELTEAEIEKSKKKIN